jgi:leucyl aminopeptidase
MKIVLTKDFAKRAKADSLVIPVWESNKKVKLACSYSKLSSLISSPIELGDFKGKEGETLLLYLGKHQEKRCLIIGLGQEKNVTQEILRTCYGKAIKACMSRKLKKVNVIFPVTKSIEEEVMVLGSAEGVLLANYAYNRMKSDKKITTSVIEQVNIIGIASKHKSMIDRAKIIASGVHLVRDLVNNNADDETATHLASVAKSFSDLSPNMKVTIFDKKKIEKEKMDLLLAVNRGSEKPPSFIVLDYKGDSNSKDKTILVGKGVTYDTGGLSLKPTASMEDMKSDMSGGAAVLGALYVAALLDLKVNVMGIVPAVENAIGPDSYKPGDIYRSYSGKTVEVVNTDAEGRLILADALAYAVKNYNPTRIINIASLTGSIVVALGEEIAGLFCGDQKLASQLKEASKVTGEQIWQMPLYKDYLSLLKSKFADIKNCGSRYAGSITAALFLGEFIKDVPWAHLDVAGTNYLSEGKRYHPVNGTGFGVRLVIEFLESIIK